jgi:hypothetical protein
VAIQRRDVDPELGYKGLKCFYSIANVVGRDTANGDVFLLNDFPTAASKLKLEP